MTSGPEVVPVRRNKIFINELGQLVIDDREAVAKIKPYVDNLDHMTSTLTVLKSEGCPHVDPPISHLCHCGVTELKDFIRLETV